MLELSLIGMITIITINEKICFMKRIACLIIMAVSISIHAQSFFGGQDLHDILFRQSVKSCEEFMNRFNEEEYFPDLDKTDSLIGQKNFVFLFFCQLAKGKDRDVFLKDVFQFYDSVRTNKVKLSYESKKWYAELRANFFYKKDTVELGLVFQTEHTPKNLPCWMIVGVNGLEKIGYTDSISRLTISPEQHEAEFIEIESDFKYSAKEFSKFRSYKANLDALSYFFALIESGTLTFDQRISTNFHFFDVPSYFFSVRYYPRKSTNTGWLIYDYRPIKSDEKNAILSKLLSK